VNLTFYPMDRSGACEIARWCYEPPYDVYNLVDDENTIQYVLDPENNFYRMVTEDRGLVGFCSFGKDGQVPGGNYQEDALDIGMGIRPELTGQGQGSDFAAAVLDFAQRTFMPNQYRVTIAAFNQRAQRVWNGLGFRVVQSFHRGENDLEFIIMVRKSLS